jgi:phosphatidyl-myo-inositol dimannoside synthase
MTHFVTHEFAPFRGGVATYVREVARAAAKLGYPVRVIAPDYGTAIHPADQAEIFPIERVPCSGRLTPGGIWSLSRALAGRREALRESRIVLLSVGAQMAMMTRPSLTRPARTQPMVACFHGSEVSRFVRHPIWRRLSARFLPQTSPAGSSKFVMRLLHESGLYPSNVVVALAPCACPVDLVPSSASVEDVNSTTANTSNSFRLLTLARLHPRKGQDLTARALGLLPDEFKKRVHYEIVGGGPQDYRRVVERACAEAGISYAIRDAVAPDQLTATYSECDAFVMTSVRLPDSVEGFGLSYLEASIHGKPIVAFRSGGVEEAVLDGQTGLLVDEGDLPGVADAVVRLMRDPELRRQLGRRGREYALSVTWDTAAHFFCGSTSP